MRRLTPRQQEILQFVEEVQVREGVVPSTREIQQHFGFASQTAAMNHLRALERKGAIHRHPRKARALSIIPKLPRERIIDVPVYGQIAAGMAASAEQEFDGVMSIDAESAGVSRDAPLFALKVRGDSMIGAQINEGDLVLLEHREPKNRDIVAALIDGETTLKRYVTSGGRPFLKAENPLFPDLIPVQELVVQGVMVALIRRLRN